MKRLKCTLEQFDAMSWERQFEYLHLMVEDANKMFSELTWAGRERREEIRAAINDHLNYLDLLLTVRKK